MNRRELLTGLVAVPIAATVPALPALGEPVGAVVFGLDLASESDLSALITMRDGIVQELYRSTDISDVMRKYDEIINAAEAA